ncbi:hypothetical protein TNCV_502311 [Trichonephila clavipes]|nr:hypothetical protein TNCV_502311 [Trichonephila clavipes]
MPPVCRSQIEAHEIHHGKGYLYACRRLEHHTGDNCNDYDTFVDGPSIYATEVQEIIDLSKPLNDDSVAEIDDGAPIKTVPFSNDLHYLETVKTNLIEAQLDGNSRRRSLEIVRRQSQPFLLSRSRCYGNCSGRCAREQVVRAPHVTLLEFTDIFFTEEQKKKP